MEEEQDRIKAKARELRANARKLLDWLNGTDDRPTRRELARRALVLVQEAEKLVPFGSVVLTSPLSPKGRRPGSGEAHSGKPATATRQSRAVSQLRRAADLHIAAPLVGAIGSDRLVHSSKE
jgi:hypothetical protein